MKKKVFNKLYNFLIEDVKNSEDGYGKYKINDPLLTDILKESNFVYVDGKISETRVRGRISKFYDENEDLRVKPKGIKGWFKDRKRVFPYRIFVDRDNKGKLEKSITLDSRLSPKEEDRGTSRPRWGTH